VCATAGDTAARTATARTDRMSLSCRIVTPLCPLSAGQGWCQRLDAERADLLAILLDVAELDVLVATDEIRQPGGPDRALVGLGREAAQQTLDQRAVLAGQRS